MTREDKTYFTRRISQGNKSDIIVVVYDIYLAYEDDAKLALRKNDTEGFGTAVQHMKDCVAHLVDALDFTYDIANKLYPLYDYVQRCLAKSLYQKKAAPLDEAAAVMLELREAFIEVAKADESSQQMQNAETVVAGYTYGRDSLNEVSIGGVNRGFYA